jgi:hypothetical protein
MSIQENFVSFIKACDLFGETFTFKIRKRKYYTSIVGGFTTLCFILYSLFYFISSLSEFFNKSNRSIENETKSLTESMVKFSEGSHNYFMLVFCMRDKSMAVDPYLNSNLKLNSYLVSNHIKNKRLSTEKKSINIENCQAEDFRQSKSFNDLYALQDFEGCKCLNLTKNGETDLRTKLDIIDRDFIQIEYSLNNLNSNWTDINNYLEINESKLFVYFPFYNAALKNLQEPLTMNIHTEIYELKPFVRQKAEIMLSLLNFTDYNSLYDDGID